MSSTFDRRPLRSWLFVPGDRPERFEKALGSGAHCVIFDLEDAVHADRVEEARSALRALTAQPGGGDVLRFVRVRQLHPYAALHADLEAVVGPGLDGVALPKVNDAETLRRIDAQLDVWEALRGLPPRSIRVAALVEGPGALIDLPAIAAASSRLVALVAGVEDYAAAVGVEATPALPALQHMRATLATVAHAAGLQAVDAISREFRDPAAMEQATAEGRALGFTGKLAIHPAQVAAINAGYRPGADEVEQARRIVEAYEAAGLDGRGVLTVDGAMVDAPVVERARRTLREAQAS